MLQKIFDGFIDILFWLLFWFIVIALIFAACSQIFAPLLHKIGLL